MICEASASLSNVSIEGRNKRGLSRYLHLILGEIGSFRINLKPSARGFLGHFSSFFFLFFLGLGDGDYIYVCL